MAKRYALYRLSKYFGRSGELDEVFVCSEELMEEMMGEDLYFSDVLGKHSEVSMTVDEDCIQKVEDDPAFVFRFVEIFGCSIGLFVPDFLIEDDFYERVQNMRDQLALEIESRRKYDLG